MSDSNWFVQQAIQELQRQSEYDYEKKRESGKKQDNESSLVTSSSTTTIKRCRKDRVTRSPNGKYSCLFSNTTENKDQLAQKENEARRSSHGNDL